MNTRLFAALLFLSAIAYSCKTADSSSEEMTEETEEPAMDYTLTPFSASPDFPDAALESMEYKDGKFAFGVGGSTYELGTQTSDAATKMCANSGKGQHIHLIMDNGPYAAKYTAEFEHEVADGEHYLLAFLSRSYHESIKTKEANIAQKIEVKDGSIVGGEDITAPMLFYSRPKGTYVGKDTEKVMLDFYLSNTSIAADGNKVKADINGEEHLLDAWQPYYVEGLPMGKNKITLTLIDKDGNKVDTPLNPVTREFTLEADPAAE